jgi:hypothetical protein
MKKMDENISIEKPIFESFDEKSDAEIKIDAPASESSEQKRGVFANLNILAEITQEHDFEYYKGHIFNIDKSEALAHIIRGISSMVGELNLAIFDIVVGLFKMKYGKGKGVKIFGE